MLQVASASPPAPTMWAVTRIRARDPVRLRAVSEGRRAGGATHSHRHVSHTAGTGETGEKGRFHTRSLCGIGFSPETLVSESRPKYLGFQVYRFTKVNT